MSTSTLAIVVSHNDSTNTIECVSSLKHQAKVVVWDNASSDGTAEDMAAQHPDVPFHAHDENILWTPALNKAMSLYYDGEDHILFSNNDIVYRHTTVPLMKAVYINHPKAGIVAPSGTRLGGMQDFAVHWPNLAGKDEATWRNSRPDVRANYVVGASMMISREVWETVGMLDNDMPLGADDHDYCLRAKEAGYEIWVVSSAYVEHRGHASYPKAKGVWDEWGKKSWEAFNKKWAGYFYNEKEAKLCHWEAKHTPGWETGTGWLSPEEREKVWASRAE